MRGEGLSCQRVGNPIRIFDFEQARWSQCVPLARLQALHLVARVPVLRPLRTSGTTWSAVNGLSTEPSCPQSMHRGDAAITARAIDRSALRNAVHAFACSVHLDPAPIRPHDMPGIPRQGRCTSRLNTEAPASHRLIEASDIVVVLQKM